jgi:secreted Zn-dependent insulinase-like peptidase
MLWQRLLDEHTRELKYTAEMAGVNFTQTQNENSFGFTLFCYNECYQQFFAEFFQEILDFKTNEQEFEDIK